MKSASLLESLPPDLRRALGSALFPGGIPNMDDPEVRANLRREMVDARREAQDKLNLRSPYVRAAPPKFKIETTTYRINNSGMRDFSIIAKQTTGGAGATMLGHLEHSASYSLMLPEGISQKDLLENTDKYLNQEFIVVETIIRTDKEGECSHFEDFVLTMRAMLIPMDQVTQDEPAPRSAEPVCADSVSAQG